MDTNEIQQRIHDFCEHWTPRRGQDKEVLPQILKDCETGNYTRGAEEVLDYLRLLVKSGDTGITRAEIYVRLFGAYPRQYSIEILDDRLDGTRNRINALLLNLPSNYLSNYQVRIHPSPVDEPDFDNSARIEMLVSTTGTITPTVPMDRISFSDPLLRIACASYDSGDYHQAIEYFARLLPSVQHGHTFTNAEIIQFLYFFSKNLLKLNWYYSLGELIAGPYRRFSQLLQNELDAEWLQIEGMRYRQQLDITSALVCFDRAISLLEKAAVSQPSAKLSLSLADAYVLQTQAYLDQTVCLAKEAVARESCLELAQKCVEQARRYYIEFWTQSNMSTHYEGRLKGTQGFITVAESIIFPERLSQERWEETESDARGAFEPERDRKPFGIVAGKYALAIIWLAKGQWLMHQQAEPEATTKAERAFEDALQLLSNVYKEHILSKKVYLGPEFEMPKMKKALATLNNELERFNKGKQQLFDILNIGEEEQAFIAQAPVCIYTPLV
jgi:tetratricopeptide (TPR) repeat protein